jgi:hypothetical protein
MEKDLLLVLEDIKKKVDKFYDGKKKEKFNTQIEEIAKEYSNIEIPERHMDTYESLIKKGKELLKESNMKDEKKISYYLRYCAAAEFDFKGNVQPLNLIMKAFLLTCVLFMVLAPQYFGPILPLIFVVPIFMALRGMKKRVLNGLMIGVSVVPMGILVSTVWIKNAFSFNTIVNNMAAQYPFSVQMTQNLAIAFILMSAVLLGSSITLLYSAIKYRKMFI